MARRKLAIAILAVTVSLAGCTLRGRKPQPVPAAPTPAPPPAPKPSGPLSIPQTSVEFPPPQPVDPRALETAAETPPPEPEPAPAKTPRRPAPAPAATGSQAPLPVAPPPEVPAPAPVVEERPRLQEPVSPEEKRRLADEINNRKREINDILQQASRRNLPDGDRGIVERVHSFLQLSDQAAARGELRQADSLSERALVMARELRNAR